MLSGKRRPAKDRTRTGRQADAPDPALIGGARFLKVHGSTGRSQCADARDLYQPSPPEPEGLQRPSAIMA